MGQPGPRALAAKATVLPAAKDTDVVKQTPAVVERASVVVASVDASTVPTAAESVPAA